jgi:hypothetical protein
MSRTITSVSLEVWPVAKGTGDGIMRVDHVYFIVIFPFMFG